MVGLCVPGVLWGSTQAGSSPTYWLAKERKTGQDRRQEDMRRNGHTFNREEFSVGDVRQEMDLFMRI